MRLKFEMYFSRSRSFANSSFRREAGTSTFLWRARTALRTHVRKSATGSETDILSSFPRALQKSPRSVDRFLSWPLPGGLDDARNLAAQRQLPEADTAQSEVTQVPARTAAAAAPV